MIQVIGKFSIKTSIVSFDIEDFLGDAGATF